MGMRVLFYLLPVAPAALGAGKIPQTRLNERHSSNSSTVRNRLHAHPRPPPCSPEIKTNTTGWTDRGTQPHLTRPEWLALPFNDQKRIPQ